MVTGWLRGDDVPSHLLLRGQLRRDLQRGCRSRRWDHWHRAYGHRPQAGVDRQHRPLLSFSTIWDHQAGSWSKVIASFIKPNLTLFSLHIYNYKFACIFIELAHRTSQTVRKRLSQTNLFSLFSGLGRGRHQTRVEYVRYKNVLFCPTTL